MREVVEAHAGAEVAGPGRRAAHEARSCSAQVALEQRRVAGHGVVGGVHQRVPVDLVEPDRRVAPERPARGVVDRVARQRRPSRPAAASSLRACRRRRARRSPRRRRRGAGRRPASSSSRSPAHGPGRPGFVVTYGAPVTSARRSERARASLRAGPLWPLIAATECVSSSMRVGHRVGAAATAVVVAVAFVPEAVEALLHAVGEGPVAGVVVRGGGDCGVVAGAGSWAAAVAGATRASAASAAVAAGRGKAWGDFLGRREWACSQTPAQAARRHIRRPTASYPYISIGCWPHPNVGSWPHPGGSERA